jgi:hypothetical protein
MKTLLFGLICSSAVMASGFDSSLLKKFSRGKSVWTNIDQLNALEINELKLKETPWTSSYLPAIRGYAAEAYATNPANPISFKSNLRKANRDIKDFRKGRLDLTNEMIEGMSTADKYDLLVGNFKSGSSLSTRLWDMGKFLHNRFGKLTFWTGMCHGWSPAAVANPAPKKTVYAVSADGQHIIPFFPNDIKSLLSIAYANNIKAYSDDNRIQTSGNPAEWSKDNIMPIHGYACRNKYPRVDRVGRALPGAESEISNCEDVNPAFWHLTILNLLGRHQQGLVVDIDQNDVVNNHPTAGYKVKYFNPITGEDAPYRMARVLNEDFPKDLRVDFRHPDTKYIVGVEMEMTFVDYQFFNKKNARAVDMQKMKKRSFVYDLEIDSRGFVVGGEWKSLKRNKVKRNLFGRRVPGEKPDFLWYAPHGMKAPAFKEGIAKGEWREGMALPQSWANAAKAASFETNLDYTTDPDELGRYPFRPQPEVVFKIAKRLLDFSRK